MRLPEVRDALRAIADQLQQGGVDPVEAAACIRALVIEMYRRPPVKHARAKAQRVTPEVAQAVRNTYASNPYLSNREIGLRHNIDGGRVSEILAGERT